MSALRGERNVYDDNSLFEYINRASCVWRDGKRIGSFQDSAKWLSLMNCCMYTKD